MKKLVQLGILATGMLAFEGAGAAGPAAEIAALDRSAGKFFALSGINVDLREALPRELGGIDVGATLAMGAGAGLEISLSARGPLYGARHNERYGFPFLDPFSAAAQDYFSDRRERVTSVSDGKKMRYGLKGLRWLGTSTKYYPAKRQSLEWVVVYDRLTDEKKTTLQWECRFFALTDCF